MERIDLSSVSTDALAQELISRNDLRHDDGLLSSALFRLRAELGAIVCVDAFPVRKQGDTVELGVICRNTGLYDGKFCSIGGIVAHRETVESALRRHVQIDVGVGFKFLDPNGWQRPTLVRQWGPWGLQYGKDMPQGFGHDPGKHAVSLVYLVALNGDPTHFGSSELGQEARGFAWFSRDTAPRPSEFGYGFHEPFYACMKAAEQMLSKK